MPLVSKPELLTVYNFQNSMPVGYEKLKIAIWDGFKNSDVSNYYFKKLESLETMV